MKVLFSIFIFIFIFVLLQRKCSLKAIFVLCLLVFSTHAHTGDCTGTNYWAATNDGTQKSWSDSANWVNKHGNPTNAPTDTSVVCFNGAHSLASVKLTQNTTIRELKVSNPYSGTINLNGFNLITNRKMAIHGSATALVPSSSLLRSKKDLVIGDHSTVTASGSGKIEVKSNLKIYGTLTAPSSQGSFIVKGGFNLYSGGTFNHNNGTVTLTTRYKNKNNAPTAAINIQNGPGTGRNFYNLTKRHKKNIYLANHIEIENDFTIVSSGYVRAQHLNGTNYNITVGGDINIGQSGNFQAKSGKVILNGSSAQTIKSAASFKHLQISNSDVSLLRAATVSGTLTIDSGATLDINGNNLTAVTLANNGNLQLKGDESTFAITNKDFDSGTITYDGTATGLAYGNTYYNLAINSPSGTMTLNADIDVDGSLTITDGTLNTGNNDINVAGNWTNIGSFVSGTGKVIFDGISNIVTGGTGDSNDFHDITLSGTVGSQSSAIAIDNDFEITSTEGKWYTNCFAMTVSGDTTEGNGSIETTLSPTVTFSPANSATGVVVGSNLTLTFNVAIRNTDNSAIDSTDLDTLITLKTTNSSGSDIAFGATYNSSTKTITITPDSDFSSEQVVYYAISTDVENECNTALASVESATFTAVDTVAPTVSWSPLNGADGVAVDANITLTFSEAVIQNNDAGTVLTDSIVKGFITLKENDVNGNDIAFAATINDGKTAITINPDRDFSSEEVIYVAIGNPAKDSSGNANTASIATFTAKDIITPTLSFSPIDGAGNVPEDAVIEIEFSEAMRKADNDATITDAIAKGFITLKTTNSSGSDIAFGATYNSSTKTITITPDSDFSSEQVVYIAISNNVEDEAGNAISASSATFTVNTIGASDTTAPSITFLPADTNTDIDKDANITLTFNEKIRLDNADEIDSTNIDSLITLKETNASGNPIGFAASINTAKTVITIDPDSDFSSEQVIYVAIGASVEDESGNAIIASSATFKAEDTTSPTIVFDPYDAKDLVPVTKTITLTFNEKIQRDDNTTLNNNYVDALIILKDTDENGTDIGFDASINYSTNTIITIVPNSNFSSEQTVYLAVCTTTTSGCDDGLEDLSDNAVAETSITFVTADSTAPSLEFTPDDSATGIAVNSDITISFDEPIFLDNGDAITNSTVDDLITLKTTNSSGTNIDFDAVIINKQLITIAPSNDFSSEQVVYVAIGASVEDASGNVITASSITFTTADETAPTVAFVPPDATNCVPISSNVTLTFSEAVRNPDDSAIDSSDLDTLITLEYTADGSPVAFTATIDLDKKVITVNPDSDFISGEVINVAIDPIEDFSDNVMSATSGTFCVVDSTAPTITFSPANRSKKVAEDTDITLTFDEEIRLINDSALNNTNVDDLITLRENDANGNEIAFDATIDSDKKVITIDLVSDLSSDENVYVAIGATVEDSYNNAITKASATFTTGDSLPPTVEIEAVIIASIATDSDITFTFSEKIRLVNDSEADNTNVGSLITLKNTDVNGADIPFSATINSAKTIITINPTSNFSSQQIVYAEVPGNTFEDYSDNLVPKTTKTFTAEYLKTSLSNPLNEKDVVGLIEAQAETAKRMIQHSTTPVLKRMEWLRRHRDENNLSHQGVKLKFVNSTLNDITNTFNLSSFINNTADIFGDDWAIWSEGSVTIGEIDENTFSSIKGIKSSGITIGIDKIVDKNQMYGAAMRIENDDNDIGTSGTKLDTDGYSLSLYGTFPFSDKTYIDSTLGIGLLRTDLKRVHESGTLSGKRKGEQVFGSILYGAEFNNNQLTLSPYGRLDAGYTKLKSYSDSGTVAAINYNDQKIKTARASIGLLVDDEVRIREITFMPNARIEYGKDLIDSSDAIVSYNVYPNTNYTLNINKEETDNFRVGVGADIEVEGGWLFMTDYERNETESSGYENTLSMGMSFNPNSTSEYSFSIIGGNSSNRQIGLDFNKSFSDDWSVNASFEAAKISTLGYNNTVQFSTEMSF